ASAGQQRHDVLEVVAARESQGGGERHHARVYGFVRRRSPGLARTGDDVALAVGDVEIGKPYEVADGLDALGAHRGAAVTSVSDERGDQRCAGRVVFDAGHERAIEL